MFDGSGGFPVGVITGGKVNASSDDDVAIRIESDLNSDTATIYVKVAGDLLGADGPVVMKGLIGTDGYIDEELVAILEPVESTRHEYFHMSFVLEPRLNELKLNYTLIRIDKSSVDKTNKIDEGFVQCKVLCHKNSNRVENISISWREYRKFALSHARVNHLFRGVSRKSYGLSSKFHRNGRNDLNQYFGSLQPLSQKVSQQLRRRINIDDPRDLGELLFLLQHHGYPTPLMDWSLSPFVAAFFAFRGVPNENERRQSNRSDCAKIYVMNNEVDFWAGMQDEGSRNTIDFNAFIDLSLKSFDITDNVRAGPQQGVSLFTSVPDVEDYLLTLDSHEIAFLDEPLLRCFEISWDCREEVMLDLKSMGITAESLFPGLDGICEAASFDFEANIVLKL